jgi:ABC-2 type transport system ATP-binding protein
MVNVLEASSLGKRYGHKWALRDCTLQIPTGYIVGLVGPNGAGKTTLLHLAMGLLKPTQGTIRTLGADPVKNARQVLSRIGFVSQEHPLYKTFTVKDMLTWGGKMNLRWSEDMALKRLEHLGIPLRQQTGRLSGGQQAQLALLLALAKQPELLVLDEPMASLDPLARHEFQLLLKDVVVEYGLTVIISSHIVSDLERFCDYLVILSASRVQISSTVDQLLQSHKLLIGSYEKAKTIAQTQTILQTRRNAEQCTLLVQTQNLIVDPAWNVQAASLEDIVLAYLAQPTVSMQNNKEEQLEAIQ